jgi:hypothetical protein
LLQKSVVVGGELAQVQRMIIFMSDAFRQVQLVAQYRSRKQDGAFRGAARRSLEISCPS